MDLDDLELQQVRTVRSDARRRRRNAAFRVGLEQKKAADLHARQVALAAAAAAAAWIFAGIRLFH